MILEVESLGYGDAAGALLVGNRSAAEQHHSLASRLDRLAGMAGDDATASEFAAAYDAAASEALAALADVAAAFATLGRLSELSLANHRRADAASTLTPGAVVHDGDVSQPASSYLTVLPATPPSSLGGDPPMLTPQQAWVLDHIEGFAWPDADVERLREAGQAWRGAAGGLDELAADCEATVRAFETQRSPEIPLAVDATTDLRNTITDLAVSCAGLGAHCDAHADAVEQKRAEVLALVREILMIVVEGVVIGVALGVVTAGLGAAGGLSSIAARVTGYSPRFAAILASLRTLTSATATSVRLTHEALRMKRRRLERFLGVPVRTEAGTIGGSGWGRGWLARHEHSGGHTLSRHVGRSEEELRRRLAVEQLSRASTFRSGETAERAVEAVLTRHADSLARWMASDRRKLTLESVLAQPTGISVSGSGPVQIVNGVRVVIVRDLGMPDGYRILTAYPQL